ncbi:MAG: polysaccharide pyruvyl transferase family protein [Bacteroidales bacterium]|nr:polysaccharide pyruvyl transferase family protein [Bacteroidales bacterium]
MNRRECYSILYDAFKTLITSDYILLDLPYFSNVGDLLIWQATEDMLSHIQHKCLYKSSIENYQKPDIGTDTIILFIGGGNFGDLWVRHQEFRHKVMADFPNNTIIQMPQSVRFDSEDYMKKDIDIFAKHVGKTTICLRDKRSFDIIKENYKNVDTLLLPDMVLGFDMMRYCEEKGIGQKTGEGTLLVMRDDCEKTEDTAIDCEKYETRDWPHMTRYPKRQYLFWGMRRIMTTIGISQKKINTFTDFFYANILKDYYIKSGIKLINSYETVYSTRLHAAITAWLLGKKTYMIDNSYGKCSGVYNQWISDQENISLV